MIMNHRRVVVTGLGVVSPLGSTVDAFWDRLKNGQSGVRRIQQFDSSRCTSQVAGEVIEFDETEVLSKKELRRTDPFVRYGLGAAQRAMADSGLDLDRVNRERMGVLAATGIGGLQTLYDTAVTLHERGPSRISPFATPQMITNILAGRVAIEFGLEGPNFGVVSACAGATHCLGESMRIIQHGEADVMLAGGGEGSISELGVGGFAAMKALTRRNDDPEGASRPFDRDRDGFVIAEGAGILVLEELEHARTRGATIYGELKGYGRTCDAYHITAPSEDGRGGARAMQLAMAEAEVSSSDVDYINAHGTSTGLNDRCETLVIKKAMGEEAARSVAISSTKSMTGHLLGAAGAIEGVACVLALRDGVIPPTINYQTPDPECDLDYTPNQAREVPLQVCLSNSLGFGGHNATLCFTRWNG